jgi:hypothetical protein
VYRRITDHRQHGEGPTATVLRTRHTGCRRATAGRTGDKPGIFFSYWGLVSRTSRVLPFSLFTPLVWTAQKRTRLVALAIRFCAYGHNSAT